MSLHVNAQKKILSEIIVCCSVLLYLGVFRSAEYVFGHCFGVPRHVDAQEKIWTKIIVCISVLTVPDAQKKSLTEIIVCSSVWTVSGGFSPR